MNVNDVNLKKFEIVYSGLCRNIKKIFQIRPDFFTNPILKDYNHSLEKIGKNFVMCYNFREGVCHLFLIVLKLLDDPKNMIEGMHSRMVYRKKYIKRVKGLLKNLSFELMIDLTDELYHELMNRVAELKNDFVTVHNINYGIKTNLNNTNVPHANEINTTMLKTASWRVVNSPINHKAPIASATPVNLSPKTFKSRKSKSKTVKGSKI